MEEILEQLFYHTDLKIYQIASVETRAKRRYLENKERGLEADLGNNQKEI